MTIYLIRHGQTDWNTVKRLQGRTDIPLNESGVRIAKLTSEAMKDIKIDVIYTSPLKRAYDTAMYIKRDRDISVIQDDRLIELCFGEYEGLCISGEDNTIPDKKFHYVFDNPSEYKAPSKAESLEDLIKRTGDFLQELVHKEELQDKTVLVSTHGAALMGLLYGVNTKDLSDFWHGGVHKNCAITILNFDGKKITVEEEGKVLAE